MSVACQMRRGLWRLMEVDADEGVIIRAETEDNGRGVQAPRGTDSTHSVRCRVAEAGGVWGRRGWTGGQTLDSGPCLFAAPEADVRTGDTLEWRGNTYLVGEVSRPHLGGEAVALQAKLTPQAVNE